MVQEGGRILLRIIQNVDNRFETKTSMLNGETEADFGQMPNFSLLIF